MDKLCKIVGGVIVGAAVIAGATILIKKAVDKKKVNSYICSGDSLEDILSTPKDTALETV